MKFSIVFVVMHSMAPFILSKTKSTENRLIQFSEKSLKLPACQACKVLVDSIITEKLFLTKESVTDTNIEDTSDDVMLFNIIFEKLCRDERAKDQCHSLAGKSKDHLLKWWLEYKVIEPDLLSYLCVEKLQYCCPSGRFGPNCNPCPGFPDRVCNGNGKCKGNGTRKGNGQCSCDLGYTGLACAECGPSYYSSYKDDNKMLCVRCHSACEDNCTQAGPGGCTSCRGGWRMDKRKGCTDVNECFSKRSPCKRNEFCVNNEGSFSCLACDKSCETCTGDGPDMCDKCANGFVLKDNLCVNQKYYVSYSDVTRYLTYIGLCFATYIVFQNSPSTASVIGICVAIYVTVSEYLLGTLSPIDFTAFSKTIEGLDEMWHKQ